MKKLLTFLLVSFLVSSFTTAQVGEKFENWSERFAENIERIAENVERNAEKNAEHFAAFAEKVADNVEQKYERGKFGVNFGNGSNWNDQNTSYLGIHSDHLSKRKAEKLGFENAYGSYVSKVIKNSAADKAGIQPFDYIYGVNDQRTSNNQDISDILEDYDPGDEVTVLYIRNGKKRTVQLSLGAYNDFDWHSDEKEAFLGVRPADGEYDRDLDGVSVEIVNNSSAEEMGLEDGDIIKSINGYQVLDWDDLSIALNTVNPGDDVPIVVERDGNEMTKNGSIRARSNSHTYSKSKNKGNWNWDWDNDNDSWFGGSGAFLGVFVEKISEKKARKLGFDNPYGSYITGVIKNTGADKAGLEPFDYIYGIDEYRVGEEQSLGGILRRFEAGDEAVVHIWRKGKKMKKEITFLARQKHEKSSKNKCEDPFFGIIQISKGYSDEGVRIKPVRNSTAKNIGLEEGDVITHLNGYPMIDWTDIGAAINMTSPDDIILVDYVRDGEKRSASGKIASYAETKNCDDCDCDDHNGFDFDFGSNDIKISGGNRWIHIGDNNSDDDEREDVSGIEVGLQSISDDDARALGAKGIDMPISNDLEVDRLNMSPNPNMGMFELEFEIESEGNTMVKVFNQSGRAIYEYDLGRFSGDFSDYIDIAQNGAGTYFLQISQDGKAFVRKIVLTKN